MPNLMCWKNQNQVCLGAHVVKLEYALECDQQHQDQNLSDVIVAPSARLALRVTHHRVVVDQNRLLGRTDHAASLEKHRMLSARHVQKAHQ
jgi:hypothetical protein